MATVDWEAELAAASAAQPSRPKVDWEAEYAAAQSGRKKVDWEAELEAVSPGIKIPGNIDMAVKDDVLYADSFIDLVAIDISNINAPREVHRVEDVFPYNAYQAIGEDVWLSSVDQEKGVVVGYEN